MSSNTLANKTLLGLGVILLVLGFLITVISSFWVTPYSTELRLLHNLGNIAVGIAFELLGLGLIMLGKK